jgi:hypothetical protein
MTSKRQAKYPTEEEIDRIVIDQADDDTAWGKSVRVKKPKTASLAIPSDLAARAAFLARLHGLSGPEEWATRVIRERVELEEVAISEAKKGLSARRTQGKSPVRR